MRKILLSLIVLLFIAFSGNAQEKKMSIGLGIGIGYVSSKNVKYDIKNGGVGFNGHLNYMYNINYNISVGAEVNNLRGILGSANFQNNDNLIINSVDMLNFVAKGKYTFGKERRNSGARFFAGLEVGAYGIRTSLSINTNEGIEFKTDRKYNFGFTPEIGVVFGVFYMAASYDFPGKYKSDDGDFETRYNAIMLNFAWNIGFIKN
jgi:hypothetical protein